MTVGLQDSFAGPSLWATRCRGGRCGVASGTLPFGRHLRNLDRQPVQLCAARAGDAVSRSVP